MVKLFSADNNVGRDLGKPHIFDRTQDNPNHFFEDFLFLLSKWNL